ATGCSRPCWTESVYKQKSAAGVPCEKGACGALCLCLFFSGFFGVFFRIIFGIFVRVLVRVLAGVLPAILGRFAAVLFGGGFGLRAGAFFAALPGCGGIVDRVGHGRIEVILHHRLRVVHTGGGGRGSGGLGLRLGRAFLQGGQIPLAVFPAGEDKVHILGRFG